MLLFPERQKCFTGTKEDDVLCMAIFRVTIPPAKRDSESFVKTTLICHDPHSVQPNNTDDNEIQALTENDRHRAT